MYGEHINLMKVTSLTEDKYEEEFARLIKEILYEMVDSYKEQEKE